MARILDKTQDSQPVVELVEDLRQAIFIYQVGTIGNHRHWAELRVGIAIATAINRKPGLTVGCKLSYIVSVSRTDGLWIERSPLLTHF